MRFYQVQALRGFAAIGVILFHVHLISPKFTGGTTQVGSFFGAVGLYGVDLFFVISGFIMRFIEPNGGYNAFDFIGRRVARVVPIYWIVTLLFVALCAASTFTNSPAELPSPAGIIKSLFFFRFSEGSAPVLFVGWSLEFEMFFYLCIFLLLLYFRKPWTVLSIIFSILVVIGSTILKEESLVNFYIKFLTNPLLLEFISGVCVAAFLKREAVILSTIALLTAIGTVLYEDHSNRVILAGLPSAAILFGACELESRYRKQPYRLLVKLGDASYSIYLIQVLSISVAARLFSTFLNLSGAASFQIFVSFVTLLSGYALYVFVEHPIAILINNSITSVQGKKASR